MDRYAQRDFSEVEHEAGKSLDVEHGTPKGTLVEALQIAHEKHTQDIGKILKKLHAEHERSLARVVDSAVRQAIAEVAPAPSGTAVLPVAKAPASSGTAVLPVANQEAGKFLLSQGTVKEGKRVPTKHSAEGDLHKTKHLEPTKNLDDLAFDSATQMLPDSHLEQTVAEVNDHLSSVVKMARADSRVVKDGWHKKLDEFVSNPIFDYFVAMLILANALVIAIQTNEAALHPERKPAPIFEAINQIFTVFFAVELAIRIAVEKQRFIFGRNKGWNFFDSFVVLTSVLEGVLSTSSNALAIRVLRITRLVRVIRVIRTLRAFNDLRAMVRGIFASVLSLVWAMVLLFTICFVIGVFITQVVTEHRKDQLHQVSEVKSPETESLDKFIEEHFGSLSATMYSLYRSISGGDDWSYFATPLFEVSQIMGFFFCMYITFAVFAVLNVVTGVFVDNAIKANQQDADVVIMEQTGARKKQVDILKSVFKKADIDTSGFLSWREFHQHLDNPFVQAYFRQLDLDIEGNGAVTLFNMLDFDDSGSIDIEEFIFGCAQLRGYARSIDLARVGHAQRAASSRLITLVKEQNDRLDAMFGNFTTLQEQHGVLQQAQKKLSKDPGGNVEKPISDKSLSGQLHQESFVPESTSSFNLAVNTPSCNDKTHKSRSGLGNESPCMDPRALTSELEESSEAPEDSLTPGLPGSLRVLPTHLS